MKEIWKDINGYEGLYQVSNCGRIKSFRGWNGKKYVVREKILHNCIQYSSKNSSYKRFIVVLTKNKKRKYLKVHQLVAKEFIPNPNGYKQINHIDNNPLNNNVYNLEWCTQKENVDWCCKQYRNTNLNKKIECKILDMYKKGLYPSKISQNLNFSINQVYRVLRKYNVILDGTSRSKNVYSINLESLIIDFKKGISNKELAKKYNCSNILIATRKYQYKKGMIKCKNI